MERAQIVRYLRIAVTALSLTACVLLIALWVRSYWWFTLAVTTNSLKQVHSLEGTVGLVISSARPRPHSWQVVDCSISELSEAGSVIEPSGKYGFSLDHTQQFTFVQVPYWLLVFIASIPASAPWIRWTFSLRTLLIVTTLVAVGLGVVIYLAQ